LKRIVIVMEGLAACATLAGCGGASEASYYPSQTAPGYSTVDQAELELDALERSLGLAPVGAGPVIDSGGANAPVQPVPLQPGAPPSEALSTRCETACDSLASMTRAAERICSMSGPGDRCARAESRVSRARAHVVSTCGKCS
jgi:hypothetical protein